MNGDGGGDGGGNFSYLLNTCHMSSMEKQTPAMCPGSK